MASTPSTGTDHPSRGARGERAFAWEQPTGHGVRLLERITPNPGIVLDLGCGYGTIADPLAERGFTYVGVDIEPEVLAHIGERGYENHSIDLEAADGAAQLLEIVGTRHVAAVFLFDVLNRVDDADALLGRLRLALDELGRPPLLISVPNVAHVDVAAKLVFGRWDQTDGGLLERGRRRDYTALRLAAETRAAGLLGIDVFDVRSTSSDQRFPVDHPALARHSPAANLIRVWREGADPFGSTTHFVRAFVAADLQPPPATIERPASLLGAAARQLTVVMRTQGRRMNSLREALTCLAAQTIDTFDVLLMVHTDEQETTELVAKVVEEFHPSFSQRVSVINVPTGGGRARPLNAALDLAQSEYISFFDDDDHVTAHWAETVCEAMGGGDIVRSQSCARLVAPAADPRRQPYEIRSGLEFRYSAGFDLAEHLWQNQTPICSYSVPRGLIEAFGLRFDEEFSVLEDWEFLLRCASLAHVRDTGKLTSIVTHWVDGAESSMTIHTAQIWKSLERLVQERLNERPYLLPAGTVAKVVDIHQRYCDLTAAHTAVEWVVAEADVLRRQNAELTHTVQQLDARYQAVVMTKRWRVLGPPARAIEFVRRVKRRLSRS